MKQLLCSEVFKLMDSVFWQSLIRNYFAKSKAI